VSDTAERTREVVDLDRVIIRFAGDSGDGMQLTGDRFTSVSAVMGNDLATLPEFPAEIRAPAGTLAGVSAFQIHISDHEITTPGDAPNVLVAMNPAALKSELHLLELGGTLIVNSDTFEERNLTKAGYRESPLGDGSLEGYTVYEVPMTSLTKGAVTPLGVKPRDADRSKNFFALGLVSWMYTRPVDPTHPTSSTSCRSTRTSASARCRPKTRSPASARRSARPSADTSATRRRAVRAWRSSRRRWASRSAWSCRW
jgi:2-oxoglutarate ferredoxin oxidoreductase subunit alpha